MKMKCAKCGSEIGEIKGSITTGGLYCTDFGSVEIRLVDRRAVRYENSERCNDCYGKDLT